MPPKKSKAKVAKSDDRFTTIKVAKETQARLAAQGRYGDSMDVIIDELLKRPMEVAAPQTKGLEDVVAGKSQICFIDGHEGRLLYRGYDIRDLAPYSTYEETTYLLWNGQLPLANELHAFSADLASKRALPKDVNSILTTLPKNCDAMDALRVGVATLGIYDDPMFTSQEKAMSIASKVGTIVAAIHRHKHDQPPVLPKEDLSTAANFLYMMTGKEPTEESTHLMDVLLILHADHELNASTFTARVIASTLSDVYSAVTGAVGALKGPLHGGANEVVVEMTAEIGSPDRVDAFLKEKLAKKQKISGFGHRVYKTMDPRARILKDMAHHFPGIEQEKNSLKILDRVETILKAEKNLYPNVDLYSGLALTHLGIPTYLFTPVFAFGRTPGWLAHVLEQYSDNRIIRPRADYVGTLKAEYIPVDKRVPVAVSK